MKPTPFLILALILSACVPATAVITPTSTLTTTPTPSEPTATVSFITQIASATSTPQIGAETGDLYTANNIQLGTPTCDGKPTLAQTEGPYYTPNTPERNSLIEPGVTGQRLLIVGYALDVNCQPIPGVWLDFWQADANGIYDNAGYHLRGHQYTDWNGRYFLETIYPGEYTGRTLHIHVKALAAPQSDMLATQLYFPGVSANSQDRVFDPALVVCLETLGETLVAYFNFVLEK